MPARFEHHSLHARLASAVYATVLILATGATAMLPSSQAHAGTAPSPWIVKPWVDAARLAVDRRLPDQHGCGDECNVVGQPAPAILS